MAGGITFGAAKDSLRLVVANGVGITSPRIMPATNSAIFELMIATDPYTNATLITKDGMATYDVMTDADGFLLLPKQLENSYAAFILTDEDTVNGQKDVKQGWIDCVNPFTYIDPSMAHDNPLVDYFLVPDPDDNTILRRKYRYPGISGIATVRITGKKAFLKITQDTDFLLIQNVPAIELMIQGRERRDNFDPNWKQLKDAAILMLADEAKAHQMDPRRFMTRKAGYEADLVNFQQGSKAWTRARLALEMPGGLLVGKEEFARIIDRAQLRMMEKGIWKGCLEEFDATITDGHVYFPARVQSVLAADLCGVPIDIRSIFYKYLENGPGDWDDTCGGRFEDEGEDFFPNSGLRRRKYRARIGTNGQKILAVCKLRWEVKEPEEQLTIVNLEANRAMVSCILLEQAEKWGEAGNAREEVLGKNGILQSELGEYLAGIKHTVPFITNGYGMGDIGMEQW